MLKIHKGDLSISSPAFEHGGWIPDPYTCLGEGISPPLEWSNPPEGTKSFALICDDPDAPLTYGFAHWVHYDIPAEVTRLDAGETPRGTSGVHDHGELGYYRPGAPPGHGDHFYYFHVYALDAELGLQEGLDKFALLERIDDHIIEQARVVGRFGRT